MDTFPLDERPLDPGSLCLTKGRLAELEKKFVYVTWWEKHQRCRYLKIVIKFQKDKDKVDSALLTTRPDVSEEEYKHPWCIKVDQRKLLVSFCCCSDYQSRVDVHQQLCELSLSFCSLISSQRQAGDRSRLPTHCVRSGRECGLMFFQCWAKNNLLSKQSFTEGLCWQWSSN